MGNQLKRGVRRVLAAMCLVASPACGGGSDPDPRTIAASWEPPRLPPRADGPQLVVTAAIAPDQVPAAPAGESAARAYRPEPQPEPRRATMLLGRGAAQTIDTVLTNAFAKARGGGIGETQPVTDRDAIEWITTGRGDFAVIGGQPSQRDLQLGLCSTRLGVELFALSVAPSSPLRSLSHQQVRQILTAQVRTWAQLGVAGGDITVVVPGEQALAERAARALIPGDLFAESCRRVASERHVADQLLQNPDAIGVVRVTPTPEAGSQKLLQIDWCPPTLEAFGYGTYPFGVPVTLVTRGAAAGIAQDFAAFTRTPQGRELLGRTLALQP